MKAVGSGEKKSRIGEGRGGIFTAGTVSDRSSFDFGSHGGCERRDYVSCAKLCSQSLHDREKFNGVMPPTCECENGLRQFD
jgi:hypothetical protein